jgi:hypothetical protein
MLCCHSGKKSGAREAAITATTMLATSKQIFLICALVGLLGGAAVASAESDGSFPQVWVEDAHFDLSEEEQFWNYDDANEQPQGSFVALEMDEQIEGADMEWQWIDDAALLDATEELVSETHATAAPAKKKRSGKPRVPVPHPRPKSDKPTKPVSARLSSSAQGEI